jgi:hypothetical protein
VTERTCDGEPGTCGFCGVGGGYLGEQGDDVSQLLHAAVRSGEAGDWSYAPHPNAYGDCQLVRWCGECVGGLAHKYQRYDDTNLRALFLSSRLRLELDGLRWTLWEADEGPERVALKKLADDPAVHLEKLRARTDVGDMQNELFRRAGFDLTTRGWRP